MAFDPVKRAQKKPCKLFTHKVLRKSQRRESNPQPPVYKTGALPLSYIGLSQHFVSHYTAAKTASIFSQMTLSHCLGNADFILSEMELQVFLAKIGQNREKSEFLYPNGLPRTCFCDKFTACFGAVAQLGERLHGMQEVVSSNLISSITHLLLKTNDITPC